jgi:hypothetical protein
MHGRTRAAGEASPRAPKTSEGRQPLARPRRRGRRAGLETSNRNNYQGRVRAAPLLSISAPPATAAPPGMQCNGCCACLHARRRHVGDKQCGRLPIIVHAGAFRVPLSLLHALHPFACCLPVRQRLVNRACVRSQSQRRVAAQEYFCLAIALPSHIPRIRAGTIMGL